jgi:hypothetical protein
MRNYVMVALMGVSLVSCKTTNGSSQGSALQSAQQSSVTVLNDHGVYTATLKGDAAKGAFRSNKISTSKGGLNLDCSSADSCVLTLNSHSADFDLSLSQLHETSPILSLSDDAAKALYNASKVEERFISREIVNINTYEKAIIPEVKLSNGGHVSLMCFKKVSGILFLKKSVFNCSVDIRPSTHE